MAVAEQAILIRVRQRNQRRSVRVRGEPERCERAIGSGDGGRRRSADSASIQRDDVDRAGIRIRLQCDEQLSLADHAHLGCAACGRSPAAREREIGRTVQPLD